MRLFLASIALFLAVDLAAPAVDLPIAKCAAEGNLDEAIEACSSVILASRDRSVLATAHYNRAGWYLKKDDVEQTLSDLTQAIHFDPKFAAAYTKRGLAHERNIDVESARADFSAALKLSANSPTAYWAHAMARERLAAIAKATPPPLVPTPVAAPAPADAAAPAAAQTAAQTAAPAAGQSAAAPAAGQTAAPAAAQTAAPAAAQTAAITPPQAVAPASSPAAVPAPISTALTRALEECNAKAAEPIKLPSAKGDIQLNRCYRGRAHMSCTTTALLNEAVSVKQDYAAIAAADYPNLKNLDDICKIPPECLAEHLRATQSWAGRWKVLRREYNTQAECTNSVEDSLRNLSLADMSYAADIVRSMVETVRTELMAASKAENDVLNLADQIDAAGKALATIQQIRSGICR